MLKRLAVMTIPQQDSDFLTTHYTISDDADWRLTLVDEGYRLANAKENLSLTLNFNAGNYQYRNQHPAKEPLVKAIKIKQKLPQTLIDATPGVLKDSLMLAGRGVDIVAIERNPLLFVMVRHALAQMVNKLSIDYRFGDARHLLPQCAADVIYLDPMYPSKKKNAQVKQDMQVLHHIIGADDDASELLVVAQQQQARVIVKRPSYADPLGKVKPSFIAQTGATRFDVYLSHQ